MTTIEGLTSLAKARGIAVASSTLALGAGFLAGFYFAKRHLETKIYAAADAKIEEQIDAARKHFTVIQERDQQPETPEDAVERLIPEAAEALTKYRGDIELEDAGAVVVERSRFLRLDDKPGPQIPEHRRNNVWDDPAQPHVETDFEYAQEIAARTTSTPYVISSEEFEDNVHDHAQMKVTYFSFDDLLLDEQDEIVEDPEGWVGKLKDLRFGHRSGNNRLVYMRSHQYGHDFAVALQEGPYAEIVAGFLAGDDQ